MRCFCNDRLTRVCRGLGLLAALLATPAGAQNLVPGAGWSGPYWGLTGGGAWADAKHATKSSDLVWSGHLGYGVNLSAFYLGAEVDATWGGASSSSFVSPLYSSTLEVDWSATARARAGLAMSGVLLYVTGGAAWSGQTFGVHSLGSQDSTTTRTLPGTVIGAGLELKLLPFVTARIEALHYDFSPQSKHLLGAIPASISSATWKGRDFDETVVRAGLSLRFN